MIQNVFNNQAFITAKALKQVKNNLVMASRVARRWDGDFAGSFRSAGGGPSAGKIGDTLNIRKPWFPTIRHGATASPSAYADYYTPVQLFQGGVDVEVTVQQMTLNVDEFYDNVVDPMAKTLYQDMDYTIWSVINPGTITTPTSVTTSKGFNQFNGNIGTPLANMSTLVDAYAVMKTQGAVFTDDDKIHAALNPHVDASIWQGLTTLFHPGQDVSNRWRNGEVGMGGGIHVCSTANAPSLTLGTWSGTILYASGATDGGNTIVVSGMTGTFNPGEHFTINGVNAVNPMGKATQGELKHFVVTSQSGTTITFDPPMYLTGPLQNISALPVGGANVNPWGFTTAAELTAGTGQVVQESLVFHEEALAFCMSDLIDVASAGGVSGMTLSKRIMDKDTGLRASTLFWLDGYNHKLLFRLDALYNAAILRDGFGCIVVH